MDVPNKNQPLLPNLDLILVEGGDFFMGDDNTGSDRKKNAHQISINSFYICKYQVTQVLWESVMGGNPSRFKGERRPVEQVSWIDAQDFIKKLNKETGKSFRLPSEAEWEYAARGGKYSQGYTYAGSDKLKQVGWYRENSNNETHDVGLLLANELGLYDMSGNVWEWCEDDYHENYNGAPEDGSAWIDSPNGSTFRVLRGGSWINTPHNCRCSHRNSAPPEYRGFNIGFRLVLSLQSVG